MICDITAVILAGGKNSRIKKEKSLIKINGYPLIDKQVELLRKLFEFIIISTDKVSIRNRFLKFQSVEDEFKNCGPLAGIHAAMKHCSTDAVFVFACDMPLLDAELILKQVDFYRQTQVDIVVPEHEDGIEPLHAIYSIKNLPYLEMCIKSKKYSVRSFYRNLYTEYFWLEKKYIKNFFNINTPSDLNQIETK